MDDVEIAMHELAGTCYYCGHKKFIAPVGLEFINHPQTFHEKYVWEYKDGYQNPLKMFTRYGRKEYHIQRCPERGYE